MLSSYAVLLWFLGGGVSFVVLMLGIGRFLRPHRPNMEKLSSYECGEEALGGARGMFHVRYYLVALLFILFEIELVFLLPWAKTLALWRANEAWARLAFAEMSVFLGILALGLLFVVKKGYLQWKKPSLKPRDMTSSVPEIYYEQLNERYTGNKS